VAIAAQNAPQLRQVAAEDQATVLHLLTKRRQDLVAARTQTINRLHRLLLDLVPGGARRNLTAKRAAALLATVTTAPCTSVQADSTTHAYRATTDRAATGSRPGPASRLVRRAQQLWDWHLAHAWMICSAGLDEQ
jgi:hypothetical protein